MLVGAATLPLAGCDLEDLLPGADPSPLPSASSDERLVDEVTTAVRTARDLAARATDLNDTDRDALVALHAAHLRALEAPVPAAPTTPAGPATAAPTPADGPSGTGPGGTGSPTPSPVTAARVRAAEQALEQTLARAAVAAREGGLARLLACMSAAVAQRVTLLPARTGGAS